MTNRPIDGLREDILRAPDETDPPGVPPRFDEARDHLRLAVERIERAGIPAETLHAVLMSETLPRLIDCSPQCMEKLDVTRMHVLMKAT